MSGALAGSGRLFLWALALSALGTATACGNGHKPPSGTNAPSRVNSGAGGVSGGVTIVGIGGLTVQQGPSLVDSSNKPRSRVNHTATIVGSEVMIVGGFAPDSQGPGADMDIEFFDETKMTVRSVLNSASTTAQLQDGLMTGPGQMNIGSQTLPFTIAWRAGHSATRLSTGQVVFIGGFGWDHSDSSGNPVQEQALATMHIFDPATKKFTLSPTKLKTPRFLHNAVAIPGDQILVAGGQDANGNTPLTVEMVDFNQNPPAVSIYGTGTRGLLLAVAGQIGNNNGAIQWGGIDDQGQIPVNSQGTAVVPGLQLENNQVVPVGLIPISQIDTWCLYAPSVVVNAQLWYGGGISYDLSTQALAPQKGAYFITDTQGHVGLAGRFYTPRAVAGAAVLNSGDVLVAGGHDVAGQLQGPSNSVAESESWDPATQQFSGRVPLIQPRAGGVCITMGSGRVAHIGGSDQSSSFIPYDGDPTEIIEIYSK